MDRCLATSFLVGQLGSQVTKRLFFVLEFVLYTVSRLLDVKGVNENSVYFRTFTSVSPSLILEKKKAEKPTCYSKQPTFLLSF